MRTPKRLTFVELLCNNALNEQYQLKIKQRQEKKTHTQFFARQIPFVYKIYPG